MSKKKKNKRLNIALTEEQYNFLLTFINKNLSLAYKIRYLIDKELEKQKQV